jgi:predicted ATPase/DNA-binding SARP family transcriptional activator
MVQASADLPIHLTRFIGRDRELSDLARLVAETRLVTLTGAGGSGKTRLAREAAARAASSFDRVGWVDLAALSNPDLLVEHVAGALHVPARADSTPLQSLIDAIRDDRTLIVLDNCEHMVSACADLAESLLRACPLLTVLATSREALGVSSETAWLVPPLESREATQLFVERAQSALPTFSVNAPNVSAIDEICRRLDGIPLAIELAAARVRVLSPEQIAARLDDAFRLLTTGSRTALPRHRTLRATMDWSFSLLAAREQTLLQRLAVFAGSFTLDAAESVCAGAPLETDDILDGISALVDKSLVVMDPSASTARYRLLETVRQYAIERLTPEERETLELSFSREYLALVERVAPSLIGGPMNMSVVEHLVAEYDNIRAALVWSSADARRVELALRFVGGLFWFWYSTGQFREARKLTDVALELDCSGTSTIVRGRAMLASALIATAQGEYPRACADYDVCLSLLRPDGDPLDIGTALAKCGAAHLLGGELDKAIATLDEAVAFTAGRPASDIAAIFARFWRGWAAYVAGDLERARSLTMINVAAGRSERLPTTLGHALTSTAHYEIAADNIEDACAYVAEAIDIEYSSGDGWGIAIALDVVALIAARRGRLEDAARMLGAVDAHRHRLAVALPGLAPRDRQQLVESLQASLGSAYADRYREGQSFSTAHAVQLALAETARHTVEQRIPQALVQVAAPAPNRTRLRVLALGPLQVYVDDRLVDPAAWGSARPRELLAYLLMHPDGRTKEQVGLAFWPEASAAQLRNSFHVTLHRLRKALGGAEWVTVVNDRYRVDPELVAHFDVSVFERDIEAARRAMKRQQADAVAQLERAVEHFRGDFLDGEPVGDWHLEHRDRLQRLYVDSLMELAGRFLLEERFEKAADACRRVLTRDELHEEALQALMRCHAALGERAQALRAYRRFADRLREELDAEPGRETIRLSERLQQGAPAS